ncbi:DEAD (Asp-Glu-Ala-Asp) box polypeptide 59 [Borealophlyctis nickersoniae]|nr:DEAD (Asp-Glu-Ala-Asp) box polypeptide 59 [Borealophlyctis nickersoniae]
MEGQKMSFHDDGEKQVAGPIVSWSLGSDCVMQFRRKVCKRRAGHGDVGAMPASGEIAAKLGSLEQGGMKAEEVEALPFLPVIKLEEEEGEDQEVDVVTDKDDGFVHDADLSTAAVAPACEDNGLDDTVGDEDPTAAAVKDPDRSEKKTPRKAPNKVILKLLLRHGDVVIMHGAAVQKNFEHAVAPKGLRFAVTARTIVNTSTETVSYSEDHGWEPSNEMAGLGDADMKDWAAAAELIKMSRRVGEADMEDLAAAAGLMGMSGRHSKKRTPLDSVAAQSRKRQQVLETPAHKSLELESDAPLSATTFAENPTTPETVTAEDVDSDVVYFSADQRWPDPFEPVCTICGKYGAYICDETDNDVCSLECKALDLQRLLDERHLGGASSSVPPPPPLSPELKADVGLLLRLYKYHPVVASTPSSQNLSIKIMHGSKRAKKGKTVREEDDSRGSGQDLTALPGPVSRIDHIPGLHSVLVQNFTNLVNGSFLTPIQAQCIPYLLSYRNLLASSPTGSGKTLTYLVPICHAAFTLSSFFGSSPQHPHHCPPYALILSPTRELAAQIENTAKQLVASLPNMRTALIVGGAPISNQIYRLQQGAQIAIATPGRLMELMDRKDFSGWDACCMIVVDEVDRMVDMGFLRQLREVMTTLAKRRRCVAFFSATVSREVEETVAEFVREMVVVKTGQRDATSRTTETTSVLPAPSSTTSDHSESLSTNIRHTVMWVQTLSKKRTLFSILSDRKYYDPSTRALIFVDSKAGAELLAAAITKKVGVMALSLHGDKSQEERARELALFRGGKVCIMVSTGVLARGIDVDVALVINFDMASSLTDYIHQVGRCGRLNKAGWAITFLNAEHKHLFVELVRLLKSLPGGKVTPLPHELVRAVPYIDCK